MDYLAILRRIILPRGRELTFKSGQLLKQRNKQTKPQRDETPGSSDASEFKLLMSRSRHWGGPSLGWPSAPARVADHGQSLLARAPADVWSRSKI